MTFNEMLREMTSAELKSNVEDTGSYFFTRKSMGFFGDTMKNYGVCLAVVDSWSENGIEVWELYRKRPVKHGLSNSAYFRKDNFKQVSIK